MGYEQKNFNIEPEKEKSSPRIIPYAETLQQEGESDNEYIIRYLNLTKKIISGEVIFAEPTSEELAKEKIMKNAISSQTEPTPFVDEKTQKKIDQMKSRKDLDY